MRWSWLFAPEGVGTGSAPEAPAPAPAAPAQPLVKSRSEIARELFGKEYYGEVKPAADEEKTETEETEEPKPVDTQADDVPPVVEEPAEGEEPGEGEETAPDAKGEIPIASLEELAEHFELDMPYVQSLKVKVNVDGIPTEATISDLVKSYQLGEAAEHRLEKAKSVVQEKSQEWAAKHQELETQFQVLAELIKHEEATLERDVKAIDPQLRDTDPAEWAARTQEFAQRRAQIAQIKVATVSKYQAVAEARARESEALTSQFRDEQAKVLLEKLPEWKDASVADVEKAEIANYAMSQGYAPQELDGLIDHRHVITLRKAMLYDKSLGKVDTAKKRVAKVPRIMKPGAPKPAAQLASERIAGLKAKLNKTGDINDAIAYRMAKRGVR